MTTVFTVGHGTRSTEELARVVVDAGAGRIVDVRRFPGSRRHPHLAREALELSLPRLGLAYEWRGEELGGRRKTKGAGSRHPAWRNDSFRAYADYMDTDEFQAALRQLIEDARKDPPLAIMCAETLWWRCHRRLIADALVLRGLEEVVHLVRPGESVVHELHDSARADDAGRPVYDVGVDRRLPLE